MDYEKNLMIKIAWLYYKEGLTQQKIGEMLGVPRQRVIKYLDIARLTNIVQIQIDLDAQDYLDIQREFTRRYNLDDVYIVPTAEGGDLINSISMAAAQYVSQQLENVSHFAINVGAGQMVTKTLGHLRVPVGKTISLISLTGGVSYFVHPQGPFNVVHLPQERVHSYIIPAPLCASTPEAAQCYLNEPSVLNIMDMSKLADMTLIGIGSVSSNATMVREGILTESDIALLQMRNVVGDMLSQFYDINGNVVEFATHDRFITHKLTILRQLKKVVGVAGGKDRVLPICGALNGGYLNVLITDKETALAVLEVEKP